MGLHGWPHFALRPDTQLYNEMGLPILVLV